VSALLISPSFVCSRLIRFNQKATDALLNFETVKYFNAEFHEEQRYDKALKEYSMANIRSQQTLAMLNNGQAFIITAGTVGVMILAARLVVKHDLTVGDWVMLFQFILTLVSWLLWRPVKVCACFDVALTREWRLFFSFSVPTARLPRHLLPHDQAVDGRRGVDDPALEGAT
jgi:ABC-type multidrug transport system fused ATPase/permease subunit